MSDPFFFNPYIILSGLSRFIPVPFLDEAVSSYFDRRLVIDLANAYRLQLSKEEIAIIATGQAGGALKVAILETLKKPVTRLAKMIGKEFLLAVQISQVADSLTHAYYHSLLLDYAFSEKLYQPGSLEGAQKLRAAVFQSHSRANRNLLVNTIKVFLQGSLGVFPALGKDLLSAAKFAFRQQAILTTRMRRFILKKLRLDKKYVLVENNEGKLVELAKSPVILSFVADLNKKITQLPEDHFSQMKFALRNEMMKGNPLPGALMLFLLLGEFLVPH